MNKAITYVLIILIGLSILGACSNLSGHESKYDRDLENGIEKYENGQDMTEDEYNAVKNMKDWSEKNSTKSYDEWDD